MSRSRATVTVIMPVYNTAEYLSRCIDSLLAQTYTDWHLLLVDDGSTDTSAEICRDYCRKDPRISLLQKANGGAAAARNYGLQHIGEDAEYVTFCDSDDSLAPDYLKVLVESSADDTDCVICGMTDIYPAHTTATPGADIECEKPLSHEAFLRLLKTGLLNSPCNKLYRRRLLDDNGVKFDTEVYNEDVTLNIEYFRHCRKVKVVPDPLYNYHHRTGSVTSALPSRALSDYMALHEHLTSLVPKELRWTVEDFVSYQYTAIVLRAMRCGDMATAAAHLRQPLVQTALKHHIPYSTVDRLQTWLLRRRWLRAYAKLFF